MSLRRFAFVSVFAAVVLGVAAVTLEIDIKLNDAAAETGVAGAEALSPAGPTSLPGSPALSDELDPIALLYNMSNEIAKLDRFIVTGEAYVDARLAEGQIIEHASKVTVRVKRPSSMRMTNQTSEGLKEIYFNAGVLTVSTQPQNYYAQAEIPEGIGAAAEFATRELGIDAPLIDLLMKNVSENLSKDARSIDYLGTSLIRDAIYNHIGIRGPEIDLQIWIPVDGPALPAKMVMTSKWEAGSPRFVAFLNWEVNPEIKADSFEFTPPEGAIKIQFLHDSQ